MTRFALVPVPFVLSAILLLSEPPAAWAQSERTTPVSAAASSPETRGLTLEQAVHLALAHNRQVQNAALEVAKDDDRLAAAHTYRLPAVSLYALGSQLLTLGNRAARQPPA